MKTYIEWGLKEHGQHWQWPIGWVGSSDRDACPSCAKEGNWELWDVRQHLQGTSCASSKIILAQNSRISIYHPHDISPLATQPGQSRSKLHRHPPSDPVRVRPDNVKITSFDQPQRLDHINLNIFEPAGHAADEGSVVAVLGHILPNIVRHVHLRYCHVWPGGSG